MYIFVTISISSTMNSSFTICIEIAFPEMSRRRQNRKVRYLPESLFCVAAFLDCPFHSRLAYHP